MVICSFSDSNPANYEITVKGKRYRFEWFDHFGPLRLNRDGSVSERHLPVAVIDAIQAWIQHGKRVKDGMCVWALTPDRKP